MSRVLALLALLALFAGAANPQGLMPGRTDDGVLVLKLCSATTGHAGGRVAIDTGNPASDDNDGNGHCAFGVPGSAALPDMPPMLAATPAPVIHFTDLRPALTGIYPASLPPATGPPAA